MRSGSWLIALAALAIVWTLLGHRAGNPEDDPRRTTGENGIVMVYADWCGYCERQREMFDAAGVRYTALDFDREEGKRAYRALAARGVPVTVVGQNVIRGFDVDALRRELARVGYKI